MYKSIFVSGVLLSMVGCATTSQVNALTGKVQQMQVVVQQQQAQINYLQKQGTALTTQTNILQHDNQQTHIMLVVGAVMLGALSGANAPPIVHQPTITTGD